MAYIFEQEWFMTEIVKHLLNTKDLSDEMVVHFGDQDKIEIMGSHSVSASRVQGCNVDRQMFLGDEFLYLSMLQNTVKPIGYQEEDELCYKLLNLKWICSNFCLVSKTISNRFREALGVDWITNKCSVLRRIIQLEDSYFGLLRWGPYWTQNLDEEFTEIIFPNILIEMRNAAIDELIADRFAPGDVFEYKINTITWLNKDAIYLRNRKKYIKNVRPQMLNTFKIDNWDLLEDPCTTLKCDVRAVDFKLVITKANWDKFNGLRFDCHTEKVNLV